MDKNSRISKISATGGRHAKSGKGGFAYHTVPEVGYSYVARHFDDRKICELTGVHLLRPTLLSMNVNKNSSFIEMFKSG